MRNEANHRGKQIVSNKASANFFVVTGFYYTSEREPHVTVDRSLQYSKLAFDVLSPKGYKMINAFDVTAAFAYDTDGQVSCMVLCRYPIVITQKKCSLSKRHSNLG